MNGNYQFSKLKNYYFINQILIISEKAKALLLKNFEALILKK
jgi:hypothetical protein